MNTPTARQQYWADAAEEEASRNPVAATLFWLLAQPSPAEQRQQQRAATERKEQK